MLRFVTRLSLAVGLVCSLFAADAHAQRLNGSCRGIARRGYAASPGIYRSYARSSFRPGLRRSVPVFRTSASPYYFGGRTTFNKALRGNHYCGVTRLNTFAVPVGVWGFFTRIAIPAPLPRVRKAPVLFTSTPVFSDRITYGDKYGWNQLAAGKSDEALRVFQQQARRQPNYGMPKVGYAIALAADGNVSRGAEILRYAVKKHPRTIQRMSLDAKAQSALKSLAKRLQGKKHADDGDASYVAATIAKLQRKKPAVRQIVDAGGLRIVPR